ncbi:MAG: deoxyribodipyrimidine photolyase [Alphaproteobacteria bacterium]|jgi:deoxyribodipyrimidine photo-lyase|nr:deoxyribodipyrimidine photolyase [Alphaproteobacteria bacterium]
MAPPNLLWFRQDLRLTDNPALRAAAAAGPVIPVYILDDVSPGSWTMGGASRWWLHHSLAALDKALREKGSRLVLRRGNAADEIEKLVRETGAASVFWNRCYEPYAVKRDRDLKASLKAQGVAAASFNAALLFEPHEIVNRSGDPFKVFSSFWRACRAHGDPPAPIAAPMTIPVPADWPHSNALPDLQLLPTRPDWAGGLRKNWTPGESGALTRLRDFVHETIEDYAGARDVPGLQATSRLSPHLHFGEIGPRQIFHAVRFALQEMRSAALAKSGEKFLAELGWREFCHSLLFHNAMLPDGNLRPEFDRFPWQKSGANLRAWQRGLTGYPIVDAGMRQLWQTGWMHNRVRMVTASFLVKHLLLDWRQGEEWFWDTLVDADLANNAAGWQWVAGSGADASPFFRIFNPVLQGEKFDSSGVYVRIWVPELARLPDRLVHRPWEASPAALADAGVVLGTNYPYPVIEHDHARQRALRAFQSLKEKSA